MRTKTYIKWPTETKKGDTKSLQEERKLFWKRLRKALTSDQWGQKVISHV